MDIQERKELDHRMGVATEQQNACALSRMEFDSGKGAIDALVAEGKYVVASDHPAYCRFTDALIGSHYHVESAHETREGAEAAADALGNDPDWNPDAGIRVYGPRKDERRQEPCGPSQPGDEIPF